MKNISLLLFVLTMCLNSWAQEIKTSKDFNIEYGQTHRVVDASKSYLAFGDIAIAIKTSNKATIIQKYEGTKMTLSESKELPALPRTNYRTTVIEFNDKALLIYELYNKSTKSQELFAIEIDPKSLNVSEAKKLLSVNKKLYDYGWKHFEIVDCANKDVLAIMYSLHADFKRDKSAKETVGLCTFDKDLASISSKEVTMPEPKVRMVKSKFYVDKNHNLKVLTQIVHDDSKKAFLKDESINFHWELLNINADSKNVERSKVDISNTELIITADLFKTPNNDLIIAGYYSENRSFDLHGTVIMYLSKEGEIEDIITAKFNKDELRKFVSVKAQAKSAKNAKESEDDEYVIRKANVTDVLFLENGTITVAGESSWISHVTKSDGTSYELHCSTNIYAINMDVNGQVKWFKKIPKNQVSGNGTGNGHKLITVGDDHYFFFLTNVKNYNLATNEEPEQVVTYKLGYLVGYKIDKDGTLTEHAVLDTRNFNNYELFHFAPENMVVLPDGFAVEFYAKNKQDLMIHVIIK